jgi:hypothetical protein
MNERQAKAKLKKLLGPKVAWQVNEDAPDADERAELKIRYEAAKACEAALKEARDKRYRELLAGDEAYQRAASAFSAAEKNTTKLRSRLFSNRIDVGTTSSISGLAFFHVKASGDNWIEVIQKLEGDKK